MTVATTTNRVSYNGDGATIAFPFTFKVFDDTDIQVVYRNALDVETTLILDTNYTVALSDPGGTVTLIGTYATSPPAIGARITVNRAISYTQEIDLVQNDPQNADVLEEGYDRAVILSQQLKDAMSRSLVLPVSTSAADLTLPEPEAAYFLRWNAAGDDLENFNIADLSLYSLSPFAETLMDDVDAATARATLGVTLANLGLDADLATLSLPASTTISAFGKTLIDDADAAAARATLEVPLPWTQTAGTFTATPASTSTLTMTTDLTATLLVGTPLKYVYDTGGGATTYYGIVSAITSNLLTIAGAPFDTGHDVTALYYADVTRVSQINVIIPGLYEDANNTALIASDLASSLIWNKSRAYLVRFRVYSAVHDSGATHGQASVRINNTEVNTTAGGELIAANTTWYPTVVNIDTAAYDVNPGEAIEVTAIKGTTGDASDLTVEMTFVIP